MDADYTNNLVLLANTPTHAKSLLHSMEQAASGIGLYVNSDKTDFMGFYQGVISSLKYKPLKLVDQFIYIGSNISSTENDVNIHIGKA